MGANLYWNKEIIKDKILKYQERREGQHLGSSHRSPIEHNTNHIRGLPSPSLTLEDQQGGNTRVKKRDRENGSRKAPLQLQVLKLQVRTALSHQKKLCIYFLLIKL